MQRDAVAEVADQVVAVCPQADGDCSTTEDEHPDWHFGVFGGSVCAPDLVDGGQRAHGVGDVVGAVGKRGCGSGHDLQEGVEVLDFEVVALDDRVLCVEVLADEQALQELGLVGAAGGLLGNDVDHHAAEEGPFDCLPDLGGLVPLALDGDDGLGGGDGGGGSDDLGLRAVEGAGFLVADAVGVAVGAVARAFQVAAGLCRVGAGLERLLGCVAVVVVDDELVASRNGSGVRAFEQEGSLEDVVLLQLPVLADKLDVEEGQDEDAGEESDGAGDTEDGADGGSGSPVVKVKGCSAFPNDEHGQDAGGEGVEDGDHEHADL